MLRTMIRPNFVNIKAPVSPRALIIFSDIMGPSQSYMLRQVAAWASIIIPLDTTGCSHQSEIGQNNNPF